LCVSSRGIKDATSATVTSFFEGKFREENTRMEFFKQISLGTEY